MKKIFLLSLIICFKLFCQWSIVNPLAGQNFESVHFIDKLNGWMAGQYGVIIHTSDGGINWVQQQSGINSDIRKIRFTDLFNGWAVGDSGKILYSIDGGNNWLLRHTLNSDWNINLLNVVDSEYVYIGAHWGTSGNYNLLRTTDKGVNWDTLALPLYSVDNISSLFFVNREIGWFSTSRFGTMNYVGKIFNTTDSGINWTQQLFILNPLYSIFAIDGTKAWCSGVWSLYETTSGGIQWSEVGDQTGHYINHIFFCDTQNGWIVDREQSSYSVRRIKFTSDGGNNWSQQFLVSGKEILDFCIVEEKYGWAVGQDGLVVHTTNGGLTFIEDENDPNLPVYFLLEKNYPNPFNPSTTISWQSPVGSWQTIKIYDVLGRDVATLVDEYRNAGSYEVEFIASNLPSGFYFYQLKAGEFVETKKMILLK